MPASAKKKSTRRPKASRKATRAVPRTSTRSRHLSLATTDHEVIQKWAEERGAHPAAVKRTSKNGDPGIIRLDFPGYSGEKALKAISWNEFFDKFDENDLALVYQEETARGERSNFNKIVKRQTVAKKAA